MEKKNRVLFKKSKCPPSMMICAKGTNCEGKCIPKKYSCPRGTKYSIRTDECIINDT